MEDQILFEVNNLKVDFIVGAKKLTAVEDVSLQLKKGETWCIAGESGCGKSVTASAILRLLPKGTGKISRGSIKLDNIDLTELPESEMRLIRGGKISMIFQDPMTALNPVYSIGFQLIEMIRAHMNIPKKEAFDHAVEMLKKVGIPLPMERMKSFPHQLSGGMLQRVMIAMALSTNPSLLIADEPTTALDVTIQAQILELMAKLKEESDMSIILITHDMGVVSDFADHVLIMYAGEAVESGDVSSIFLNPLHPYTRGLLESIPRTDRDQEELYTIKGTVPSLGKMPPGCSFNNRCPERIETCKTEKPPLIDFGHQKVRCWRAEKGRSGNEL